MSRKVYTVDEIKDIVCQVAKEYGIERVTLFGSYARGEAKPDSDVDLRIDKGQLRGIFQLSGFLLDLEEQLNTRVDVLTTDSISGHFLERIKKEEILLYEH
ncbi:MAG: nucleotidyltransferase [Clostridia bacterium]|nr:nucleotidyltransferase [Clostridia bacterium]